MSRGTVAVPVKSRTRRQVRRLRPSFRPYYIAALERARARGSANPTGEAANDLITRFGEAVVYEEPEPEQVIRGGHWWQRAYGRVLNAIAARRARQQIQREAAAAANDDEGGHS